MKLIKPSAGLIVEFKAVMSQLAPGEPRKMFGYDAFFVFGNMAAGLWQNTCVVKLSLADQARLLKTGSAIPFAPMKGRVMSGWLELSEELAHDPEELLAWCERAVTFVATLPPKLKKARKAPEAAPPQRATKRAPAKEKPAKKARAATRRSP